MIFLDSFLGFAKRWARSFWNPLGAALAVALLGLQFPQRNKLFVLIIGFILLWGLYTSFIGLFAQVKSKNPKLEIKSSDGNVVIAENLDPDDVHAVVRALTEGTKHGS